VIGADNNPERLQVNALSVFTLRLAYL